MKCALLGNGREFGEEINKVAAPEDPGMIFSRSKDEFVVDILFCKKLVDRKATADK